MTVIFDPILNALRSDTGATGSGDVVGPASATDTALALFDTTSGELLSDSGVLIAKVSQTDVAETRSASIDMADQILQKPELKDYSETTAAGAFSTPTLTLDAALANTFTHTLTEATTVAITNPSPTAKACNVSLILTQAGTAYAVAWPVSFSWAAGQAPDVSTVSSIHVFTFVTINAGTTWYAFHAGANMAVPA